MKLQKTIKSEAKLSGKGLFGGQDAQVIFRAAPEDTGIVFVRTDSPVPVRIRAIAANVGERSRRTALKKGSVSIERYQLILKIRIGEAYRILAYLGTGLKRQSKMLSRTLKGLAGDKFSKAFRLICDIEVTLF